MNTNHRFGFGLALALLGLSLLASPASADMSVGKKIAAVDGNGSFPANGVTALATVTISKVRPNRVILVNATVTDIDPNVDAEIYLAINNVLSGPLTRCLPTAVPCTLTFHRPLDTDQFFKGKPLTFTLYAYAPNLKDDDVQVGLSAQMIHK
jgi:hypothetical protein